jgi:hypothetical protein
MKQVAGDVPPMSSATKERVIYAFERRLNEFKSLTDESLEQMVAQLNELVV